MQVLEKDRVFVGASALLFAACAALTLLWHGPMRAMAGMPVCGGQALSAAWLRMPGQSWAGAAASFTGMWTAMMIAMMLPSLAPSLWRYRRTVGIAGTPRGDGMAMLAAAGYFSVWALAGVAVFAAGAAVTAVRLRVPQWADAVPVLEAAAVIAGGLFQCSRLKARYLAHCRDAPAHRGDTGPHARGAWRHGWRLGRHCVAACAGLTAVLLAVGVMNLWAMTLVTIAITAERLAPSGERAARAIGAIVIAIGLVMPGSLAWR